MRNALEKLGVLAAGLLIAVCITWGLVALSAEFLKTQ